MWDCEDEKRIKTLAIERRVFWEMNIEKEEENILQVMESSLINFFYEYSLVSHEESDDFFSGQLVCGATV